MSCASSPGPSMNLMAQVKLMAEAIGSTPTKVWLGAAGYLALLGGWVLFFRDLQSGLEMKEAFDRATVLFWPGAALVAPSLWDSLRRDFGQESDQVVDKD